MILRSSIKYIGPIKEGERIIWFARLSKKKGTMTYVQSGCGETKAGSQTVPAHEYVQIKEPVRQ